MYSVLSVVLSEDMLWSKVRALYTTLVVQLFKVKTWIAIGLLLEMIYIISTFSYATQHTERLG